MELAARPLVTAGIALAGASLIAVTPVTPTLPEVHAPDIALTASPSTDWLDIFSTSFNNLSTTAGDWLDAPFPFAQQLLANQIGYGEDVFNSLRDIVGLWTFDPPNWIDVSWNSDTIHTGPQAILGYLTGGDFDQAAISFTETSRLLGTLSYQAAEPMLKIPSEMLQHVTNLVSVALVNPSSTEIAVLPTLTNADPINSMINALGFGVQSVLTDGNPLQGLLNIPAMLTDGLLNGYGPGLFGNFSAGLTSPLGDLDIGPIAALLVGIPQMLAEAIG